MVVVFAFSKALLFSPLSLSSFSDSHLLSLKVPLKNLLKVTLKGSHIFNLKFSIMITYMLTLKLHQGEPSRLVKTFLLPDELKRINDWNVQYDSWKVSFQIKNKIKTFPKKFKDCVSYSCTCLIFILPKWLSYRKANKTRQDKVFCAVTVSRGMDCSMTTLRLL